MALEAFEVAAKKPTECLFVSCGAALYQIITIQNRASVLKFDQRESIILL